MAGALLGVPGAVGAAAMAPAGGPGESPNPAIELHQPPQAPSDAEQPAAGPDVTATSVRRAGPAGAATRTGVGDPVGAASQVTIETRLSPEPANVGDLLEYEVVVAFPRGVTVNLPTQLDFSPLHFVDSRESETEATGGSLRETFVISL